jgi:hypothetical protein
MVLDPQDVSRVLSRSQLPHDSLDNGQGIVQPDARAITVYHLPASQLQNVDNTLRGVENGTVTGCGTNRVQGGEMKPFLGTSRRRLLGAVGLAIAATLGTSGVALGTPPTGTVTATPLADVNTANVASMDLNQIQFETEAQVRVIHVRNSAGPGFSAGWHRHQGPVIIALTKGSLTFYDRAGRADQGDGSGRQGDTGCTVTTVTAPGGYLETAGVPIQVYNTTPLSVNSGTAEWITTQIIPPGAATRVDVTPGFCGV